MPVTARSTWLRYRGRLPTCRVIRSLNPRHVPHVHRGELRRAARSRLISETSRSQTRSAQGAARRSSTTERPTSIAHSVSSSLNRDLAREIAAGRFREDLYYWLSVFLIEVPPLRQRKDDIAHLAEHFLRIPARTLDRRGLRL